MELVSGGEYTVKSAYEALQEQDRHSNVSLPNIIWKALWKLHIIERQKFFGWLLLHKKFNWRAFSSLGLNYFFQLPSLHVFGRNTFIFLKIV